MKIVEQQSLLSFRYYFCHFNLMTLAGGLSFFDVPTVMLNDIV